MLVDENPNDGIMLNRYILAKQNAIFEHLMQFAAFDRWINITEDLVHKVDSGLLMAFVKKHIRLFGSGHSWLCARGCCCCWHKGVIRSANNTIGLVGKEQIKGLMIKVKKRKEKKKKKSSGKRYTKDWLFGIGVIERVCVRGCKRLFSRHTLTPSPLFTSMHMLWWI